MAYTSSKTDWASNDGLTHTNMNRLEENVRSIYVAAPELVDDGYLSLTRQNYETIATTITMSGPFSSPVTTYGVFERSDSVAVTLDGGPSTYTYRVIRGRIKGVTGTSNATPLAQIEVVPANYRPSAMVWVTCSVVDGGLVLPGVVSIATDGDMIFHKLTGDGTYTDTFTASGTKGFLELYFSYII